MALDHASRDRVDALTARPSPSSAAPPADGSAVTPDPEFWGVEPRRVRRRRSSDPAAAPPPVVPWWAGLLERARAARLEAGIGVVVVVVIALVAGVVWYRANAGGDPPAAPRRAPAERTRAASPSTDAAPVPGGATVVTVTTPPAAAAHRGETIVVHVAGAVVHPGVLLMPKGARVIDAVEGAGGATPTADLDRLNLAARLVDGQRVLVVEVGAPLGADPAPGGAPTDGEGRIDLNAATAAQLETLPGIGPALAGAIIAERDRRGGFRSINELREVRGIGETRFADLRERVTV